jgi:MFS family permease
LLLLLQSIIATPAGYEFNPSYPHALTIGVYVGMLLGALFWGMSGDIIGRRFAFNVSLFLCSAFTVVAGAAPSWISLAVFIALLGFGGGGNLIMDTTVFIEYLPSKKQWVLSTKPWFTVE